MYLYLSGPGWIQADFLHRKLVYRIDHDCFHRLISLPLVICEPNVDHFFPHDELFLKAIDYGRQSHSPEAHESGQTWTRRKYVPVGSARGWPPPASLPATVRD